MPHALGMVHATIYRASVGAGVFESKTHCETRLKWREMKGDAYPIDVPLDQASWKLKMHRNGTTMEANYAIDERVKATWRFTYWMDETDDGSKVRSQTFISGLTSCVSVAPSLPQVEPMKLIEC